MLNAAARETALEVLKSWNWNVETTFNYLEHNAGAGFASKDDLNAICREEAASEWDRIVRKWGIEKLERNYHSALSQLSALRAHLDDEGHDRALAGQRNRERLQRGNEFMGLQPRNRKP